MAVLPVVDRELRVASRRPSTYWGRTGTAAVAMGFFVWMNQTSVRRLSGFSGSSPGSWIFNALSLIALVLAYLAGVTLTSDCISEERREGTLGLLFLTDLRSWQIALGKLAATSVGAAYRLLALFPVLALALLLGGTTAAQVGRVVLTLLACLTLSLCTGLAVSTFCRSSAKAASYTLLALVLVTLFPWTLGSAVVALEHRFYGTTSSDGVWADLFGWISPLTAWNEATNSTADWHFWAALGYTAAVGLAAFGLAVWKLPLSWQDRPEKTKSTFPGLRPIPRWTGLFESPGTWLNRSPLSWPFLRKRFKWLFVFILLALWAVYAIILWIFALNLNPTGSGTSFLSPDFLYPYFWISSITAHLAVKLWLGSESTRQWTEDRRSGAMEWLLVTPNTEREFIRSAWLALNYRFWSPILLIIAFDIVGTLFLLGNFKGPDVNLYVGFIAWRIVFLLVDLLALGWLGLWIGISSTSRRSQAIPFQRVIIFPTLMSVAMLPFLGGILAVMDHGQGEALWVMASIFYLAIDLYWVNHAHQRLQTRFRSSAAIPPGAVKGWFSLPFFNAVQPSPRPAEK